MHILVTGERLHEGAILGAAAKTLRGYMPFYHAGVTEGVLGANSLARLVYTLGPNALGPFWDETFRELGLDGGRIDRVFENLTWPHEKASPETLASLARNHQISLGFGPLPVRVSGSLGLVLDRFASRERKISGDHIKEGRWGETWEGRIAESRAFMEQEFSNGSSMEANALDEFTRGLMEEHKCLRDVNGRLREEVISHAQLAVRWEMLKRERTDLGSNLWEPIALIGLRGGRVLGPSSLRFFDQTKFLVAV